MVTCVEITPKPDAKKFAQLVRDLITNLSDREVADLYRLSTSQQKSRLAMKRGRFKRQFQARSLLAKDNADVLCLDAAGQREDLEQARLQWQQLRQVFDEAMEVGSDAAKDARLSHPAFRLRTEMENISASLACFDIVGVHSHMLEALLAHQAVLWIRQQPDPAVLSEITQGMRSLLHV
jgi:hypothetical protein